MPGSHKGSSDLQGHSTLGSAESDSNPSHGHPAPSSPPPLPAPHLDCCPKGGGGGVVKAGMCYSECTTHRSCSVRLSSVLFILILIPNFGLTPQKHYTAKTWKGKHVFKIVKLLVETPSLSSYLPQGDLEGLGPGSPLR